MWVFNKILVGVRFLIAQFVIRRFCRQAEGPARILLKAVKKTLGFQLSPEERSWTRRIEALRKELYSSATVITRIIYGLPPEYHSPPARLCTKVVWSPKRLRKHLDDRAVSTCGVYSCSG
jgi:hypothetical protein